MVIGQQELTPNILGDAGEALSGATADTGPKHKPRGPKGRLMGPKSPSALQAAAGSSGAHHKRHGRWAHPSPALGLSKSPQGQSTWRGSSCRRGQQQHSVATRLPSLAQHQQVTVCPCPFWVGGNGPGVFLQGANLGLREEGMGMLEGAAATAIALGVWGHSGKGGGSLFQRVLGTMPSREAAVKPRQRLQNHTGWSRAARSG